MNVTVFPILEGTIRQYLVHEQCCTTITALPLLFQNVFISSKVNPVSCKHHPLHHHPQGCSHHSSVSVFMDLLVLDV